MDPRLFKGADGKRQSQLVVWFAISSQIANIDSAPDPWPYARHLVLYQIHLIDQHLPGSRSRRRDFGSNSALFRHLGPKSALGRHGYLILLRSRRPKRPDHKWDCNRRHTFVRFILKFTLAGALCLKRRRRVHPDSAADIWSIALGRRRRD